MITSKTIQLIKKHEGLRLKAYTDSVGKLTIGTGRNLTDNGITEAEADFLLQNDLAMAEKDARLLFSNFDHLSEARQAVLIDMAFNMGIARFMEFHKFITAIENEAFIAAAHELEHSVWYTQVKNRAEENIALLLSGDWS